MENTFEHAIIPVTSMASGYGQAVAPNVFFLTTQIVNVVFVGMGQHGEWVLIDAGMPRAAESIVTEAEVHFGRNARPKAIVLTHGHFDHVGSIVELVEQWDVPVYAHELELPYLTGRLDYPQGDATVDGGLVSEMSPLFPNQGIDLGDHVHALSTDGSLPAMPGWRWIPTPGHTPGHISLFSDEDGVLIAGDAFVTVKQESLYKVFTQTQEISGPPKYFTTDWAASASVKRLEALHPSVAVTGHGLPMHGKTLSSNLAMLAHNFEDIAVPKHGRYVNH